MFDVFCLPIQFPFTLASLSHGLPRLPGRWTSTDHFHGFSCPWLPVGFSQWEALAAGDGNIGEEFMAFISTGNLPNSCQTSFSIELYALGFSNCSILRFFSGPGVITAPLENGTVSCSVSSINPSHTLRSPSYIVLFTKLSSISKFQCFVFSSMALIIKSHCKLWCRQNCYE